jgi:hypothetical protein
MAMSTGAKIAVGCSVAVVAVVVMIVAGTVGLVFWGKNKMKEAGIDPTEIAAREQRITTLKAQINANPFTRPADGSFTEDRLLTFLNVRKDVYSVYEKHKDALQGRRGAQDKPDLSTVGHAVAGMFEMRLALAESLASHHMSEAEYRFMTDSVYKTLWASEMQKSTGGSASDATARATEQAAEEAERAANQPGIPEEQRKALRESAEQMRQQGRAAQAQMAQMDVPPGNIALFRKHEAEIRQYAMSGLEYLQL